MSESFEDERVTRVDQIPIVEVSRKSFAGRLDRLATEEPLEIRLLKVDDITRNWAKFSIAVTMRTPGNDFELTAGFLFSEGIVKKRRDLTRISYCTDPEEKQRYNVVNAYLSDEIAFSPDTLSRHVYTSSSCGICGKGSIEQVKASCSNRPIGTFQISSELLTSLPLKLGKSQNIFSLTGGLHASGLFDMEGKLLLLREDIGRHNALDKLVGSLLMKDELPASNRILMVSGRASFELVQKAALAGIPVLAAVGAPSNLAVSLASEYGMTLIGFLRGERFNIYCGEERISKT